MVLLAVLCRLVTSAHCLIALTGDVYRNSRDSEGNLNYKQA